MQVQKLRHLKIEEKRKGKLLDRSECGKIEKEKVVSGSFIIPERAASPAISCSDWNLFMSTFILQNWGWTGCRRELETRVSGGLLRDLGLEITMLRLFSRNMWCWHGAVTKIVYFSRYTFFHFTRSIKMSLSSIKN